MKDCNIILSSSPKAYLKQMENTNNKEKITFIYEELE